MPDAGEPASVTVQRRVEWVDTDAAGHNHWSALVRWVEAAEAALHTCLGIAGETFGSTPRVHFAADFRDRLYFNDVMTVELRVARVGTSSLEYAFEVRRGGAVAADGRLVIVHIDRESGRAEPWPARLRAALATGGAQHPDAAEERTVPTADAIQSPATTPAPRP